ncbi:hypothetical protein [Paenibacillus dokdonensis]|uniref:hypothetical protein n=1 Tax=Paenibacillus dokdonensis TaxID=2567944 RepID=UPI0010A8B68F|nr:hypothetical protein [Paenibacillus dokdonensis]
MKIRLRFRDISFDIVNYILLALLGFITLYPFINLLAVSLNDPLDTDRGFRRKIAFRYSDHRRKQIR